MISISHEASRLSVKPATVVGLGAGLVSMSVLFWLGKPWVWLSLAVACVAFVGSLGVGLLIRQCSLAPLVSKPLPPTHVGKAILDRKGLAALFECYGSFAPAFNKKRYLNYFTSEQYYADCEKTRVYCAKGELGVSPEEAHKIVSQRHLVNIEGKALFDRSRAGALLGDAALSYFHEGEGRERSVPALVGIFTHTPVFPCGHQGCTEDVAGNTVDIFSVPAPALDSCVQPHFDYFVQGGELYKEKYSLYMKEVFRLSIKAFLEESKATSFVLPEIGLGAFLNALPLEQRNLAVAVFYQAFQTALIDATEKWKSEAQKRGSIDIVLSHYGGIKEVSWKAVQLTCEYINKELPGGVRICTIDIGEHLAHENSGTCFVVNAWDPASRVGNGNDGDASFDGAIGRCTPASLVATPAHNLKMDQINDDVYVV